MTDTTTFEQARTAVETARAALADAEGDVVRLVAHAALTDPDHPLYRDPTGPHWHVDRHGEDDEGYATHNLFEALEYAGTELDRRTEHEHEGISIAGESGDFETAYRSFKLVESWAVLADNARGLYRQASAAPWSRAPLYSTDDEAANVQKLREAAIHHVDRLNGEGPRGFRVWVCAHTECAPTDDEN